jgi:hypothetical protein
MRLSIVFAALLAQIGATILAFLAFKAGSYFGLPPAFWAIVVTQSFAAILLSLLLRLPSWWLPIQGLFVPALLFTLSLNLPPGIFLAGFILLWLVFRSNTRERVPLYLSNETTWQALAELLPQRKGFVFLDLGCGLGGLLAYLAERSPDGTFHGVESAPASFLVSWLRLRKKINAQVRYGNLWKESLEPYDVVYAFLSPEPMLDLWRKARNEMRPDSLFVSNTFAVPDVAPTRTLLLNDSRRTRLLIWKM